jgi:hypothetical protein
VLGSLLMLVLLLAPLLLLESLLLRDSLLLLTSVMFLLSLMLPNRLLPMFYSPCVTAAVLVSLLNVAGFSTAAVSSDVIGVHVVDGLPAYFTILLQASLLLLTSLLNWPSCCCLHFCCCGQSCCCCHPCFYLLLTSLLLLAPLLLLALLLLVPNVSTVAGLPANVMNGVTCVVGVPVVDFTPAVGGVLGRITNIFI